ncbi:MAG: DUF3426 domain-containing protein [Gammaproteobacteria bacterium]
MNGPGPNDIVPPGYNPNQYTRCPYCMAVFRVNQEKISARGGDVRCGACREVFNALNHAVEIDQDGGFRRLQPGATSDAEPVTGRDPSDRSENIERPVTPDLKPDAADAGDTDVEAPESRAYHDNDSSSDSVVTERSEENETEESEAEPPAESPVSTPQEGATDVAQSTGTSPGSLSADQSHQESTPDSELSQPNEAVSEDAQIPSPEPSEFDTLPTEAIADDFEEAYEQELSVSVSIEEPIDAGERDSALPIDHDSTNSLDVISAYAQDPEWDKEWQEFSIQEIESDVLDTYTEHRSGSVLGTHTETVDAEVQPRNWFNAEPDSLLDNNPFQATSDSTPSQPDASPKPSMIDMGGVDQYIMDRPHPLSNIFWFFVAAAFVVLLGFQVKYFFVERYAQHDRYRSYLSLFCGVAQCDLPPRRDTYRYTITNTRIDLHPEEPGALRITVKLLNQADFEQPYPELQLTLTDRVGRVVGRRIFDPEFYLASDQRPQLASGELGAVTFDLARPHEKAVGFVVDVVHKPAAS